MTTIESDFETRLRRDLAELGEVPTTGVRELRARRRRPAMTVAVALLAVLALVAASFAIVGATGHRRAAVEPGPRTHTILEQPSAVTGSTSSILAHRFRQVCEHWRVLPGGVDCSDLQARYVWSPGATRGPYKFGGIEVVGTPDLKLAGAPNPTYPVFEVVTVHGHRARLFGTEQSLTLLWQERPDLQVFMSASVAPSAPRYPESLRTTLVAFANGMRPVAVDPTLSQYVLRSGNTGLGLQLFRWELSWRPRGRILCMTVANLVDCDARVEPGGATVRAKGLAVIDDCPQPTIGTQGLVFGIVPERSKAVAIASVSQDGHGFGMGITGLVVPPGEPHLRVFAVALDHPTSAAVSAENAAGTTIARATLPPFRFACSP